MLAQRALLEFELGNFVEGRSYIDRLEAVVRLIPEGPTYAHTLLAGLAPVASRIAGADQGLAAASWAAQVVLDSPSVTPLMAVCARFAPAMTALERGDVALAREQYEAINTTPGADLMLFQGIDPEDVLGLLAQTAGDNFQAEAHFEQSLVFCRNAGYRPNLAWTCCDYADILLQRNNDGDRAKAMSLLDESLAISSELGMKPLMERVLSRREILGA